MSSNATSQQKTVLEESCSCKGNFQNESSTEKSKVSEEKEKLIHNISWPESRPLPYPCWESKSPEVVDFSDVIQYEEFAGFVEFISQQTVAGHKYNTVENFIRFYRAFKKSKIDSLDSFYRQYKPPMTPCHYTCVGLAYELIHQIKNALPKDHPAVDKFYVTSCEEAIETIQMYVENIPPDRETVEKEHVSVCFKFQIGCERNGVLLLDPGYHVSRAVTIMEDKMYPHTGRFTQSNEGLIKKEYEYTLATPEYIAWEVIDTKKGKESSHTSLIFVDKPFLSGIDFAERRNLVYDFKSILRRDPKGQVIAGMYFPLTLTNNPKKMTIFFMENNNRTNIRLNISRNVKETRDIQTCEEQMGLSRGKLTQMMNAIGRIVHDESFMEQTLHINQEISRISAEN